MTEVLQIRPGVALVVSDERGWLLLHRRRIERGWAPVSGSIEPGESVTAAAHREALEETGLTVRIDRLIGIYSTPPEQVVRYPDGSAVHFVTTLLSAAATGGVLAGNNEGLEWGWFAPAHLPEPLTEYAATWLGDALSDAAIPFLR